MAVRDKDVLAELGKRARCTVYFSVPTVDEDAWRILEPGTAHPLQRLRAVRELSDAGINAGVLMAPIVPGLTSHPAKLEATIKAIADHGAAFMGANVLYLKDGTRTHFLNFLEKNFPDLSRKYQRLYAGPLRAQGLRERGAGDGEDAAGSAGVAMNFEGASGRKGEQRPASVSLQPTVRSAITLTGNARVPPELTD